MINKDKMPLAMGIAFVAFTTQFGGGFASGNQLFQYFLDYGIWSLIMPVIAQGLLALYFWFGLRHAYKHKTYDYKSFSDSFYGKFKGLFSNLFEVVYIILIGTSTSASFATGGATLALLVKMPYIVSTILVALFILIVVMYGTDIVRKCASTLSVLIIVGLLLVIVPNIFKQWDKIVENFGLMAGGEIPISSSQSGTFSSALYKAILYFLFQLASVGLMYQHVKNCENKKQINRAGIYIFLVNTFTMVLTILGLFAIVFSKGLVSNGKLIEIPMILFVQEGVGAVVLKPIISILIILGSVSTGVNLIDGIVARCVNAFCKEQSKKANFSFALLFTIFALLVAQTGLGNIVKIGYKWLGIATFIAVFLPYTFRMFYCLKKKCI